MQRHKELYKEQSLVLSPRNHCQENRDRLQAARAKKREDCFYQNRIISVSPTPVKIKQLAAAQAALTQENVAPKLESPEQLDTKPAEQLKESNPKVSRQKLYLQRYMEWKIAKTKEHKQQDQKRRGAAINVPTVKQSKALPKSQTFRVPDNLASAKQKEAAPMFQPPKRCSLYMIANPTGKGKAAEPIKPSIPKPTSAAAPPSSNTVAASSALARHKSAASATKIVPAIRQNNNPVALARQKAAARPIPNTTKQTTSVRQPAIEAKKITTTIPRPTPATVTKAKTPGIRQQPPVVSTKPRLPEPPAPRTARLPNVLSKPFEKPLGNKAPVTRRANVVKPQPIRGGGGAAAKFKDTAGAISKAASHSIRMKATKIKSQYTRLQDNVRKLPQLKAELLHAATLDIPPLTPLDDIHNPFIDQAAELHHLFCGQQTCLADGHVDHVNAARFLQPCLILLAVRLPFSAKRLEARDLVFQLQSEVQNRFDGTANFQGRFLIGQVEAIAFLLLTARVHLSPRDTNKRTEIVGHSIGFATWRCLCTLWHQSGISSVFFN